jgi:hypothetical protein
MVGRGAGLGGGMATLLMVPLHSALENATKTTPLPLATLHSLLIVTTPLLQRAAVKAVMLDLRMARSLATLLHGMVQAWDKSDREDVVKQATFQVLCHLVLNALALLCNPKVRVCWDRCREAGHGSGPVSPSTRCPCCCATPRYASVGANACGLLPVGAIAYEVAVRNL